MTVITTKPQSPTPTPPKQSWITRHWKPVLAASVVVVLAIGGAALLTTSNQTPVASSNVAATPTPTPSVSPSLTQRDIAISEATAALEGFTADQNTVQSDPTAPLSLLDNHGKGEMVSGKPLYREDRDNGWAYIGQSSLEDIEAVKVSPPNNPNRIILRACLDLTGYEVVNAKGETQYEPELARLFKVYTVTEAKGQWKVAHSEALKKGGERQPC